MARIAHAKAALNAIYHGHTIQTLNDAGYRPAEEIYGTLAANVA
jgi:hypothetical protein